MTARWQGVSRSPTRLVPPADTSSCAVTATVLLRGIARLQAIDPQAAPAQLAAVADFGQALGDYAATLAQLQREETQLRAKVAATGCFWQGRQVAAARIAREPAGSEPTARDQAARDQAPQDELPPSRVVSAEVLATAQALHGRAHVLLSNAGQARARLRRAAGRLHAQLSVSR